MLHTPRLDATLRAAEIGTWTWDIRKDRFVADPNLSRMFSLSGDTPSAAGLESYFRGAHPEDRPLLEKTLNEALGEKIDSFELDYRLNRSDGAIRWVTARGATLRDENGVPTLLFGAVVDITERKAAETARATLAALVESSDDAILSKSLDGTIRTWNRGARRMFGYEAQEIVGQSIFKLIPPELSAEEVDILARLRRGERIEHYETTRVRKDGSRLEVSLMVSPILDSSGHIIGASKIARDITQQKHDEQTLKQLYGAARREISLREGAEAELRENDRRKDEFLATLAHELRNPLAPIRQAALISKSPAATDDQKRWAQSVIDRQVQTMALLLDDLLDVSRITRGTLELRKESVTLAAVVEAAVETARPILDARRHHFSVRTAAHTIGVRGRSVATCAGPGESAHQCSEVYRPTRLDRVAWRAERRLPRHHRHRQRYWTCAGRAGTSVHNVLAGEVGTAPLRRRLGHRSCPIEGTGEFTWR